MSSTVLAPKEYRRELERTMQERKRHWLSEFGEMTPQNLERVGRNILTSYKIYERADYGRLADVREVIALRLAPWLAPHARRN